MSETEREIHASAPHCGVCAHVTFQDDWDRTPYCTFTETPVEITPGNACEEFRRR